MAGPQRRVRPILGPDYVRAITMTSRLMAKLLAGELSYGSVEDHVIPLLAGPNWEREFEARDEIAIIVYAAETSRWATDDA